MASPARASATDTGGGRTSVTSPSSARSSVAPQPTVAKPEKVVQLAGEGLGYPVYHAITGNLPVLTPKFHHPPGTSEDTTGGPSDYALITGNLPVLSRELLPTIEEELMPGWVELHDPVCGKSFFWNIYYRAFRDTRPEPNDDGRRGARHGEQHLYRAQMAHVRATLLERAALRRVDAEEAGEDGSGHDADGSGSGSGSSGDEDEDETGEGSGTASGGAGFMPSSLLRPGLPGFGLPSFGGVGAGRSVLTAAERREEAAKRRLARSVRRSYAQLMRRSITTVAAGAGAAAARGGPGAAAAASEAAPAVPPKELALPPAFTPLFFWDASKLTALKLAGTTFDSGGSRDVDGSGSGSGFPASPAAPAAGGAAGGAAAVGGAGGPSPSPSPAAAAAARGAPPMVLVLDSDASASAAAAAAPGDVRASGPGRPGPAGGSGPAGGPAGGGKPMAMLSEADLSDDDDEGEGEGDNDKDKGSDDGSGSDAESSAKAEDATSPPSPALSPAEEAVLAAVESSASGKAWVELFCTAQQRCYYVNRRSREVTWDSPAGDAYLNDCDQYERRWQLHWDGDTKVASYSLVADTSGSSRRDHWTAAAPGDAPPAGTRPDGTPETYDGPLVIDYWEEFETEVEDTGAGAGTGSGAEGGEGGEGGDGASSTPKATRKYYVNSLTEVTQWDKPEGWPRKIPETPPPPLPVRPPPKPAPVAATPSKRASASKDGASGSAAPAAAATATAAAAAAGSSPVSSPGAPAAGAAAGAAAAGGARKRRGTSALGSGPGTGVGGVGSAGAKAGTSAPTKVSAAVVSLAASGFGAGGRPPSPPLLDPEAEATMDDYLGDADVEVFFNEEGGDAGANDDTIVYPSYRGYLKKKGGGTSIFGRKSWKERFFVFSRGNLAYFESAADWEKGTEPLKALQISLRYYRVDPRISDPLQFALIPNYKVVMAEDLAAENGMGGGSSTALDGGAGGGRSRASSAATRASVIVAAPTPPAGGAAAGGGSGAGAGSGLRTASGRASSPAAMAAAAGDATAAAPATPALAGAGGAGAGAGGAPSSSSSSAAAPLAPSEPLSGVAALVGVGLNRFGGGSARHIPLKRPGPAPRAEPGELPYGRVSRLPPPPLGRVLSGRVLRADGSSAPPGPDDDREEPASGSAAEARSARSLGAAGSLGSPGFGPASLSSAGPGSPSLAGTLGSTSVGSLRLGSPSAGGAGAADSSYASSADDESTGGGSARGRAGTAPAVLGGPLPEGAVPSAAGAQPGGLSAASRRRRTSFATMKDQQAATAPDSFEAQAAKKASLAARVFELEAPTPEVKAKWVRALRGRRADGRHRADSPEYATLYAAVAAARAALGDGSAGGGTGAFQSVNPAAGVLGRPKSGSLSGTPVGSPGAAGGAGAGGAGAGGSFSPGSPLTGSAGAAAAAAAAAGSKSRGRRMTTML